MLALYNFFCFLFIYLLFGRILFGQYVLNFLIILSLTRINFCKDDF